MRVAYLVNQYPKVSHAFIRSEIHGLEAHGVEVERFSIRPSPDQLVDAADREEQAKTRVILEVGTLGLLWSLIRQAIRHPIRFVAALGMAIRLGWDSDRGLLRNLAYLAEACVACRWLEDCNCTHVHAHFATNSTAVAMLCHQLGGPTYSFTVHGPEEFDKNQRIALTEKIERAAFVVAISSFGRSQLFRWCAAVHWQKIHIVRCGVDRRFLDAPLVPVPDTQRLVCVGRLCEQKGQLLLIEAVARLIQEGVDIELVLAGDGEMRSAVEKAIAGHGIAERVRITGWLSSEQILGELSGARGLVLPSFAEGLPVVIMEALALCRPVLSTYVAGIPELIEPGENGWLVPAGSVEALVDALRQMLVAPTERLTSMGRKGRQRVLEAHDARNSALQLKAFFPNKAAGVPQPESACAGESP